MGKNRKRGNEANQRNNGRTASILTSLRVAITIFTLDIARKIEKNV